MSKKSENEQLREALAGMLESFDMLMEPGVMPLNDLTRGVIRGAFYTSPAKARKLLEKKK